VSRWGNARAALLAAARPRRADHASPAQAGDAGVDAAPAPKGWAFTSAAAAAALASAAPPSEQLPESTKKADKAESIAALQRKLGLAPPEEAQPPRPAAPSPLPSRAPSRLATSNFDAMLPELARRVRVPPLDAPDDDVAAPEIRRKLVDAPEEEVSGGELLPAASACGAAAVRASCGLWAAPAPVRGASWRAGCVHRRR
jgi:hypothetical protein